MKMTRSLLLVGLGCMLTLSGAAVAQTVQAVDDATPVGKRAGTFMIRLRAIDLIPEDNASKTSIGGRVSTSSQPSPELDFSYFLTDNIAAELITATTRHSMKAKNTAAGTIDVGATWVLPPTVTLQYHFMPRQRFSPYIGAGLTYAFFYDTQASGPTVQRVRMDNNVGAALQIGVDYNFTGHWFLNADVKQIFLSTRAHLTTVLGSVSARTSLDPLVVGAGIGYRF
jgi:outer membrane protein